MSENNFKKTIDIIFKRGILSREKSRPKEIRLPNEALSRNARGFFIA